MRVHLKHNGYALSAEFPMTAFEMQDALDKLKYLDESSMITFRIYEFRNMNLPSELCEKDFTADIYRLNLFVERLEKLEFSEMTAFKSLLTAKPESSFEDMLLMTYGLDTAPIFPCENFYELGEVGRRMASYEDGMFMDGYYCVPSCYEPPDMTIGIGKPERCFFRLLIAPETAVQQAQWITLPCEPEEIPELQGMICCEFQSALPRITDKQFSNVGRIDELNALAKVLSGLSGCAFVKLKAVMESEQIYEISDTMDCIARLDEYEFDRAIQDYSEFGRAYLVKNLPANFAASVLEGVDLYDFGEKILQRTGGALTSYGAVSARGQGLYAAMLVQSEQQLAAECEEEFSEDCDMWMGGMT